MGFDYLIVLGIYYSVIVNVCIRTRQLISAKLVQLLSFYFEPALDTQFLHCHVNRFKLIWCEEGTRYFSFDRCSQLRDELAEVTQDHVTRLDFDVAQRRADLLYSSDVLPQSWKKQLEPLFTDPILRKLKSQRVGLFLSELRNLTWKKPRRTWRT